MKKFRNLNFCETQPAQQIAPKLSWVASCKRTSEPVDRCSGPNLSPGVHVVVLLDRDAEEDRSNDMVNKRAHGGNGSEEGKRTKGTTSDQGDSQSPPHFDDELMRSLKVIISPGVVSSAGRERAAYPKGGDKSPAMVHLTSSHRR